MTASTERAGRILFVAPLSLSGRYAYQGRLAAAGLRQVLADLRVSGGITLGERRLLPEVLILDDESTRKGVRRVLEAAAGEADVLIGPYGSDLVREAALWAAERDRVLWNHAGSADDLQGLRGVVSVPSPASRYLASVLEAVAGLFSGARVLAVVGRGAFGRSAAEGAREAAQRLGMTLGILSHGGSHARQTDLSDVDVLVSAGSFAEDLALVGGLRRRPSAVAAVAAGVGLFGDRLRQRADGVLGPSQWEEGVRHRADLGPGEAQVVRALRAAVVEKLRAEVVGQHVDYLAAQAYAVGLLATRCIERAASLEDRAVEAQARHLACTTFFGRFGLGPDGRQLDHEVLVVQWQQGLKRVVWPLPLAEAPVSL
ncbi:MAG: ABC transporter substrate-binding protein [Actinomycetota bacterium]